MTNINGYIRAMAQSLKMVAEALGDTLVPRTCSVCGEVLARDERFVCRKCMAEMPLTGFEHRPFNAIDQALAGKALVERSYGHFYYRRGDRYCNIIHDMKYRRVPAIGEWLGRIAAERAMSAGFFRDIDVILPVPMHERKVAERGYNQTEYIVRGISAATGIAVGNNLVAEEHSSQTRKRRLERWYGVEGIYAAVRTHELAHKHVLLVDDVITTGATLAHCAMALQSAEGVRVSVMVLGVSDIDF